jgi:hypothetical protein
MSEDSTTPHESDSHASGSPEEIEAKAAAAAANVEVEPNAQSVEASVSETVAAQTTAASEPSAKRVRKPIPVAVEESGTKQTFDKVLKLAKDAWTKAEPILKEKGTQALLLANRFTNDFLDNTGPKLFNGAIAKVPESAKVKVEAQKVKLQPTLNKLQPVWEKAVVPFWQKVVVPNWNKGIRLLKQQLPANLQELTERFLTVAVITTLLVIYWFFSSLTSSKPAVAKPPAVSSKPVLTRPVPQRVTQRPIAQPSVAPAPSIRPTVQPSVAPVPAVKPTVVAKPIAPVLPKVATEPPTLAAKPLAVPTPSIDLADIQDQLTSDVATMGKDLVVSIKTANTNRTLQVSVGPVWDALSVVDRQKVAQKLWERSQKLDFKKFELLNSSNILVARSPVIGANVIILQAPTLNRAT